MRQLVILSLAATVSGCSSFGGQQPHVPYVPVTVSEIQRAIACEFQYALRNTSGSGHTELEKWGAVVELSLNAKDKVNIVPGVGPMTAKAGNATLTAQSSTMTIDNQVEDKNTMAYAVGLKKQAESAQCPEQTARTAATGLGLSEFLEGTAQVFNSGGKLASTPTLTTFLTPENIGLGGDVTLATLAATPGKIATIKYERNFTITRKAGGGLSFKVGDLALSVAGSGIERGRTDNKVTVYMGKLRVDEDQPVAEDGTISLEDSIWAQRQSELDNLKSVLPNSIVVVNPPPAP